MNSRFILESFWQKKANCVCVAFIKALLLNEGPGCGFRTRKQGKYLVVKLKDGNMLSFSKTDMVSINHKNQISFAREKEPVKKRKLEELKSSVEICFAVLVRNLQVRGHAGKELTQSAAVKMLTKEGEDTSHFHSLLGTKRRSSKKLTLKNFSQLKQKQCAILYNEKHVTICSTGYYEEFGTAVKLGDEIPLLLGKKARGWFELSV